MGNLWARLSWVVGVMGLVLVWACLAPEARAETRDHTLTLRQAERLDEQRRSEGVVGLPDSTPARTLKAPGMRTYRIEVDRGALERHMGGPAPLVGVVLERACSEVALRVNGALVYETRGSAASRFNECTAPHLASVPWALLEPGGNVFEIEVGGMPSTWVATPRRAMLLSEVVIGNHALLRDLHRQETGRRLDVPAIVSGGLLLLGMLMCGLLVFPPREPHLGYFAGLCLLWAGVGAHSTWSLPVESSLLREGLAVVLVAAASWCYQRFVCLYADLTVPALNRLGWLLLMAAPVALVVAGPENLNRAASFVFTASAALAVGSTLRFLSHIDELRRRPMRNMGVVMGIGAVAIMAELLVNLGFLPLQPLLPVERGIPLCLVLVGALQLMQFGQEAHQLDVTQRQLEHKISLARHEIEANFSRLAQARIEQVTSGERKRIAADLHDDLGAKLLTIVHTSRSDRIAALGREALDEMRLSVRGLTGRPMELSEALADWRTEAMSRLGPTGIELDWPLPLEELPQVLGSRTMVQTTRILREVFNNLIRHSQATACVVSTEVEPDRLCIEIRDNGIGFEPERLSEGRHGLGLLSMSHRARQLHGECVIESRVGAGSLVRLTLPLSLSGSSSASEQTEGA